VNESPGFRGVVNPSWLKPPFLRRKKKDTLKWQDDKETGTEWRGGAILKAQCIICLAFLCGAGNHICRPKLQASRKSPFTKTQECTPESGAHTLWASSLSRRCFSFSYWNFTYGLEAVPNHMKLHSARYSPAGTCLSAPGLKLEVQPKWPNLNHLPMNWEETVVPE
jgi:hypothetical protein